MLWRTLPPRPNRNWRRAHLSSRNLEDDPMSQFRKLALGAAALLTVALAACADVWQPLAPSGEPSFSRGVQSFDRGARRGGEKVQAFRRSRDRGSASDEALITPGRGGTVSAGGVTLRIPPHAVQR